MSVRSLCAGALAVAVLVAAFALSTRASAAPGPVATAAKACKGNYRNYSGTSYITRIRVARTSCASGRKVVKAFHRCRGNGKRRCGHRVYGYRCKESRSYGFASFDSRVTCKKGRRVVKHVYTENT